MNHKIITGVIAAIALAGALAASSPAWSSKDDQASQAPVGEASAKKDGDASWDEANDAPKGAAEGSALDGLSFEQSDSGPAISALAVAAQKNDWERWSKKWIERKGGKLVNVPEARSITVGDKIELAVILATRDKPFEASQELTYVVSIYKPDGSLQETLAPSLCMKKGAKLGPGFMGVCEMVLDFELEAGDSKGQWVFKIDMSAPGQKDLVFGTSFEAY